jgi:phosphatidylinositol-3-phosphatase
VRSPLRRLPVPHTTLAAAAAALLALAVTATAGPWAAAGTAAGRTAASGPCGTMSSPPAYKHVIWVWMENHSYGTVIGSPHAPYLNTLAKECGLATNYHNISHPSLPNYLGATSGLPPSQLPGKDCGTQNCGTTAPSIFGQGETWRAYQESMPSSCDRSNSGEYAARHNPPPYYKSLAGCAKYDVPFSQLASDLAGQQLPAFSFITPNLIDDMHDGTVAQGDAWLSRALPQIFASPQYRNGSTAVFVTWDEGEGGHTSNCVANTTDVGCHVATLVISPSTVPGTRSATLFNHYSLLGTAEQLLGLPRLGQAAAYQTMVSAFRL